MKHKFISLTVTSLAVLLLGLTSCNSESKPAHVHTFSSEWTYNNTHHWHDATCGHNVVSDKEEHNIVESIVDGKHQYRCTVCDYHYEEGKAERVYVSNVANELFKGYTYTINPVVIPYDALKNVKYVVEKPSVIEVNDNVALAKEVGNTLVYVYNDEDNDNVRDAEEAFTAMSFTIKEPDPTKSVNVQESASIKVGESLKLTYSATNIESYGMEYGFYSEDESIVTISSGTIKGHKAGKTKVSVSLQGYRAYCEVTVTDLVDDKGLRASAINADETLLLNKGITTSINYEILPSGSCDTLKEVSSNNPDVVKVNSNKSVTALSGGSAVVTLKTTNDKFTRVLVTVKDDVTNEDSYYNNYYKDLEWTDSKDLVNKLHNIISGGVKPLEYNTPNWETNQAADQDLYDYAFVDGVYSSTDILKTNTQAGWQREHAFAASLMTGFSTGIAVKALGRATDFHNLLAASAGANGSRGNKNLGYANPESAEITAKDDCQFTRKAFEPGDEDKGRLARAILYMSVMYNQVENVDVTETWTYKGTDVDTHPGSKTKSLHINVGEQPLQLVEGVVDYSRITLDEFMMPKEVNEPIVNYYRSLIEAEEPTLKDSDYDLFREKAYERYVATSMPYAIGYKDDLLMWNSFPVDYQEMQHNNSIQTYYSAAGKGTQGNRNPFVDYPQLAEYIYGELKNEPGSIKDLTPSYLTLEMDKDELHHYSLDSSKLDAFESGSKPQVDDFNLKAIKYDLSEGILDKSKIQVENYTFTDDDVATGKDIHIYTDKNTLLVHVNVVSESVITFDNCTFSYRPTGDNPKGDYSGSGKNWVADFDGTKFNVTFGQSTSYFQNRKESTNPTSCGVTIGSNSNPVNTLTFESQNSYTDVNAVFFYALTNKDVSIVYKAFVGDTEVLSGTVFSNTPTFYGGVFNKVSGKVKIVFGTEQNKMNGMSFCGIAFNY